MQTIKAHGGDARVHIYTVTAQKEVGWLLLRAAVFTVWKPPGTHVIGG